MQIWRGTETMAINFQISSYDSLKQNAMKAKKSKLTEALVLPNGCTQVSSNLSSQYTYSRMAIAA